MFILAEIPAKNVTVIYSKNPFTKNPYFETKSDLTIPSVHSIPTIRSTHTYQTSETNNPLSTTLPTFSISPWTIKMDKTYFPWPEQVTSRTNFGIHNESKSTDHPFKIRHHHR